MLFSSKTLKFFLNITIIYDDFIIFCFESLEGTVHNEPVNIAVVPDKVNNDHITYVTISWKYIERITFTTKLHH